MKVTDGRFKPCHICGAPLVQPLPEGWTWTVTGVYGLYHLVTSHYPGCEKGFKQKWTVPDAD